MFFKWWNVDCLNEVILKQLNKICISWINYNLPIYNFEIEISVRKLLVTHTVLVITAATLDISCQTRHNCISQDLHQSCRKRFSPEAWMEPPDTGKSSHHGSYQVSTSLISLNPVTEMCTVYSNRVLFWRSDRKLRDMAITWIDVFPMEVGS